MSDQKLLNSLLKEMLEVGVHFGHQTKFWNPKMKPFIYGVRGKIHIINLDKTVVMFAEALTKIKQIVKQGGSILFVGTRTQAAELIASEAKRAKMPYVNHRWLGGMLTNFETVKKSIKKFVDKSELLATTDASLSKKETLDLSREIAKLELSIGGIVEMKRLPSAIFIIDTGCHNLAVQEANRLGIPVFGVVDTNNDPSNVDYAIPGNDDSSGAISLYLSHVVNVILEAQQDKLTELVATKGQEKVKLINKEETKKTGVVHHVKAKKTQDADSNEEVLVDDVTVESN